MKKVNSVLFLLLIFFIFLGCASIPVFLKTYKKGNAFYIENIDDQGKVIGLDNIVINNITFFTIKYEVLGINDLQSMPKVLDEGNVSGRDEKKIYMNNYFSNSKDSLSNYKYICIRFPEGSFKKGSAYCDDDDVFIDIEQYGEDKDKSEFFINEELFIELEKAFN